MLVIGGGICHSMLPFSSLTAKNASSDADRMNSFVAVLRRQKLLGKLSWWCWMLEVLRRQNMPQWGRRDDVGWRQRGAVPPFVTTPTKNQYPKESLDHAIEGLGCL